MVRFLFFLSGLYSCFFSISFALDPTSGVTVPYSGRIAVNNINFTGTGKFKFAIVDNGSLTNPVVRQATASANVSYGFITYYTIIDGGKGYTSAPIVTISGGGGSGATAQAQISPAGTVTNLAPLNVGSSYSNNSANPPTVTIAAPASPPASTIYVSYWSQDGSSTAGAQPIGFVQIPVTKGLYSVDLGDTAISGMNALPHTAIQAGAKLRVWFDDGSRGFQQLSPDVSLGMASISRAVEAQTNASEAKQSSIATANNLAATTTSLTSQMNTVSGNLTSATTQLGTQIGMASNSLNTSLGNLSNTTTSSLAVVSNSLEQVRNSLAGSVFTNTNSLQRVLQKNLEAIYGLPPLSDSGHHVLYARDGVVTAVNSVLLTRDGTNFAPIRYPPRNLGIQTPKTWIIDQQGNDLYFILSNGIAGAANRNLTNSFPFQKLASTREIIYDEAVTPNYAGAISSNGIPTIWRHSLSGAAAGGGGQITNIPTGLTGIVQLVFNDYKALAMLSNGTVTNWGDSGLQPPSDLTNVRSIAIADNLASADKAAAILQDGSVRLFGSGINGSLQTDKPADVTNIRSVRFFRDNVIAITDTNHGSRVIMWGSDNLQVPSSATNVKSAFGFVFGNSTRFFVQAKRYDGSLVIWGNVSLALTNVPAGLSNVVKTTILGTNRSTPYRDYPYVMAETSDGKAAIWGGLTAEEGNDSYFGYFTNSFTPILSGVTKIIKYESSDGMYPIIVAERGANQPYVWANSNLTNVPSQATNLIKLTLTGGTNGSETSTPRFLVGETSDQRVVIWGNGVSGNYGASYLGEQENLSGIVKFKLVGEKTSYPVAVALKNDKSLLTWGGSDSGRARTNFIPQNCTNVSAFMTLDPQFTSGDYGRRTEPIIIANTSAGKLFSWSATGSALGTSYNSLMAEFDSASGAILFPYSQEEISSTDSSSFFGSAGSTPAAATTGFNAWPVCYSVGGNLKGQVLVAANGASSSMPTGTSILYAYTPDSFEYSEIEAVYPIGSARTSDSIVVGSTYSYSICFKMKDGSVRFQAVTDSTSTSTYSSRTALYFASPNSIVRQVIIAKQAGLTGGASTSAAGTVMDYPWDNLILVAEPLPIIP